MESIKIPTEIQDFRQMVTEGFLFVDKSLLIRDILNNGMKKILINVRDVLEKRLPCR